VSELVVRIAEESDLPVLIATLGQETFFRDRLARQARGVGELFVAWADSTPVGDVYLWRELADEAPVRERLGWTPTINHLEVMPAWQNRGVGTALVRAVELHATELGYEQVCLGVGVDNPAARRLYEHLGYAEWEHGLVDVAWDEPRPDGAPISHSMTCRWMIRSLPCDRPATDDWEAWHPQQAYGILQGSTVDWHVAAGWAIDLHLAPTNGGRQTREHEDLEVAIDRTDFPAWRRYLEGAGYELFDTGPGRLRRLGPSDEPDPASHQVWLCDSSGTRAVWRLDTFLEERDRDLWICHWLPSVRLPMADAVTRTADGIPYLRPELVLLGKAKHCRPKDEADLALVLPTLDELARTRLRDGLMAADKGHEWLSRLGERV
jgi:ribosomal protein S18 acetylase RimI-like enzyme